MRNFNSFVNAPFNFQLKPDYLIRDARHLFFPPAASELFASTTKLFTIQVHSAPVTSIEQAPSTSTNDRSTVMNSVNFASSVLRIPSLIFAQISENITSEYDSTFKSQEHDNDILFDTDWFGCERSTAQPAMVQVSKEDAEAELVLEPAEFAQRELESKQQRELSQFFATVLKLAGPFHSNFERTRVVNFNTELTTGLIQILQETLQMIARELELINSNHASWPQSLTSQKIPLIVSTQSKELNKFIDRYHPAIVLWCAPNQRIKRAGVSDIVLKDGFMPHLQLTYD